MLKNKSKNEIIDLFNNYNYQISTFAKDEIIALEGSTCNKIGLVLSGTVDIKKILASNSVTHLSSFDIGNFFGEIIAFSDINKYPATVVSSTKTEIMFIDKQDFVQFCTQNTDFLEIFLNDLTTKIVNLNKSISNLSLSSIRQKLCNYLLDQYNTQGTNYIMLNMTKQKLSEVLGMPRPSLSRELINLKNLNIIDYSKDFIKILDIDALEKFLME
ncbi:MAG: Crp/Fnr family transcriptional regulator [Romboutsia sp.]|uniref:Crp/Fnr family transcriptional regulator n=1 Tax=Romboutsia sp. TaxID=1965302 RepID=UPI003F2A189D